MSTYVQTALITAVTEDEPSETDDECDECSALPGEFPCADCYISGEEELPEEGRR